MLMGEKAELQVALEFANGRHAAELAHSKDIEQQHVSLRTGYNGGLDGCS